MNSQDLIKSIRAEQEAWQQFLTSVGDEADTRYDSLITARCARLERERQLFEACGMDPATMARQLRAATKG